MGAGGWVLSIFVSLLVIVLIGVAILWLVRNQTATLPRHGDGDRGSARELLDRRLVSGEIDEGEYRRLRVTLAESPVERQPPDQPAHARP